MEGGEDLHLKQQEKQDMLVSDLKTVILNREGMWLGSSSGQ